MSSPKFIATVMNTNFWGNRLEIEVTTEWKIDDAPSVKVLEAAIENYKKRTDVLWYIDYASYSQDFVEGVVTIDIKIFRIMEDVVVDNLYGIIEHMITGDQK